MFCLIYRFTVKPGEVDTFLEAWRALTLLIRDHEGGLGSRLHQETPLTYIAYAQWPDRLTWENSGSKLPAAATEIRARMRGAMDKMETLFELPMVDDLLVKA
jgi:quinol monooxygenase YgiN